MLFAELAGDRAGAVIGDANMQHRLRRTICKGWRNKVWYGRLMAFLELLSCESPCIAVPLSGACAITLSLCENYWYPLYAYLRRGGYRADQAQDLTQEFFIRLLEGRYLDRADPEKGRFRAFLLTSLKFFVADEEDRQRAHKRGGGMVVGLEFSSGEERYQREPAHDETPERIFERRWAHTMLDRVVDKLCGEFVQHGRAEHFERLKVFLLGQSDAPYAALASEMNTSEGALKVAIHRLRKRYRGALPQGDRWHSGPDPAEVESELRFLARGSLQEASIRPV